MLRSMSLELVKDELGAAWSVWTEFLQPSSEQHSLTFPALEELCLDFSEWRLEKSNESKLRVCALSQSLLRRMLNVCLRLSHF